jgi:hypothetical protein
LLHLPQRLKHAEIEVTPIDERPEPRSSPGRHPVAGHHVGFDQGITLPFAALELVIVFHVVEVHHQRAAVAIGPKPCIHPKDKPVGGGFADGLDQVPAQPGKKGLVGQGPTGRPGFHRWRGR